MSWQRRMMDFRGGTGFAAMVLCLLPLTAWAQDMTSVADIVQLDVAAKKTLQQIQRSDPLTTVNAPPLQAQISTHPGVTSEDQRNLTALWQKALDRNPVIAYGLKQLATPPELRYAHASWMTRTLNGLLSGAAILPMAMGTGPYVQGATIAGANLVDHAMRQTRKVDPAQLPSDTELVALSGMIQRLQQLVVNHYFGYKNSLVQAYQQEQLQQRLASQSQNARERADTLTALWTQSALDQADSRRLEAVHQAKVHYLVLERLVGTEGMQTLRFDAMPEKISALPTMSAPLEMLPDKLAGPSP